MIKEDEWFKQGYNPANRDDEEDDVYIGDEAFPIQEVVYFCTLSYLLSLMLLNNDPLAPLCNII